jgi:hypothetical protein
MNPLLSVSDLHHLLTVRPLFTILPLIDMYWERFGTHI